MSVVPENIRSQLAPGWSGVNIAIMIVLLIVVFPLGLLMLAYILLGDALGVDLGRPQTFANAFQRIARAIDAGVTEFNGHANRTPNATPEHPSAANSETSRDAQNTATTANADPVRSEAQNLQAQRDALDTERRRFEAEKAAFYQRRDNEGS